MMTKIIDYDELAAQYEQDNKRHRGITLEFVEFPIEDDVWEQLDAGDTSVDFRHSDPTDHGEGEYEDLDRSRYMRLYREKRKEVTDER